MNNDYKNQVLKKIQNKEISMRPKLYFVTRVVGAIVLSLLIFCALIFIVSFILFSIHESGEHLLLTFGNHGILTFLQVLPWTIIISSFLVLFFLEWILRQFKFSYRLPMIRIFLYTFIITTFLSILCVFTPIHTALLQNAEMGKLPIIGKMYEAIHDSHQDKGIVRGVINSINGNTFIISHNDGDTDADDGTWTVIVPLGSDVSSLYIGEKVYVAGVIKDGKVEAYGVGVMKGE